MRQRERRKLEGDDRKGEESLRKRGGVGRERRAS